MKHSKFITLLCHFCVISFIFYLCAYIIKPNNTTSKIVITLPFEMACAQVFSQLPKGISTATQNFDPVLTLDYPFNQINFDGTVAYCDVKRINKNRDTLNGLTIYPNPTTAECLF